MTDMVIAVGDWICFGYNGALVIGEVRYVVGGSLYMSYYTDAGRADDADVLEVRKKAS